MTDFPADKMNVKIEEVSLQKDLFPVFRERMDAGQSVRFVPKGISMRPMLRQECDSVVISAISAPLKKYDVVLYRRDNGNFVLHRIVRIGDTITCIGDHQYVYETGLRPDQMEAIVTSFYRKQKEYSVKHPLYRLYCRFWAISRPLRHFAVRALGWLRRKLLSGKK